MNRNPKRLDYDGIAPTYDRRYACAPPEGAEGVLSVLRNLVSGGEASRLLEVGCGTGFWLSALQTAVAGAYGVDRSLGMLRGARARSATLLLARATAGELPLASSAFDVVICVNALHHFDRPIEFVADARRVLRPGGTLAVIGMDPQARRDRWYLYDHFPGTLETDLARYPSAKTISAWMSSAGFDPVESGIAHRIVHELVGREVLADPILEKNGTSQLALLEDAAYAAGRAHIEAAVASADVAGKPAVFPVDIALAIVTGRAP